MVKRFKSAREQDAEYRMYEWNPLKCYMCEEVLGGKRMYKQVGNRTVCLLCLKTANDMGESLGL